MPETEFTTGRIKWFNGDKGYGFITGANNGQDIFVHIKELARSGVHTVPIEGQGVKFILEKGPKGLFAKQISLTGGAK